jgi:hypothetical protein
VNVDPNYLIAMLAVSCVGYVLFSYGRRQRRTAFTVTGVLMFIYPYFITSVTWMLALIPILLLLLWLATRMGL